MDDKQKMRAAIVSLYHVDALGNIVNAILAAIHAGLEFDLIAELANGMVDTEVKMCHKMLNDAGEIGQAISAEMARILSTEHGSEMSLSSAAHAALMNLTYNL